MNYGKQKIMEKEKIHWSTEVKKFSKLDLRAKIKPNFGTEKYLELDLDCYDKSLLSQFRYGILLLEWETENHGKGKNTLVN